MLRAPRRPDTARATCRRPGRRRLTLEALEPRLLLSADTALLGIAPPPPEEQLVDDGLGPDLAHGATGSHGTTLVDETTAARATASSTHGPGAIASDIEALRRELVLVDAGIENFQALVDGLRDGSDVSRSVEVVVLDAARDGVAQITEALAAREGLDAVHVVSHGDTSGLRLGGVTLDATTLDAYREAIGSWGRALDADADLLLYGCNLAAGPDGRALLAELGTLTGADVAASDDLTGSTRLGGDWVLEYASGRVDATSAIGAELQQSWNGVLAIGVDATSTSSTTGSSVTVSHTTSGTERLMLVGVSMGNSGSNAVQSITYNGVGLGFVGASDGGDVRSEIWQLVAPATGTHDVVVTLLDATGEQTVGVTTFAGVDQTTPLGTFVANAGDPGNATVDVGSAADELVFDVVALESSVTGLTPGAGQTELWDVFQAADTSGAASVEAGAPTVTMSWTHDSNAWTIAAVPIKPSSATNTAPVLDDSAGPALSVQNEDAGAPIGAVGTPVSQLVDFASPTGQVDNVTDPDPGALLGIAVTAADTANGSWWYTTDGGSVWNALGAVSDASARLLAADAGTRLYFQPAPDYDGTLANAITFRAWDQTSGTGGDLANVVVTETLRDEFTAVSYSNDDGTAGWANDWRDIDSSPIGGGNRITGGQLQIKTNNDTDWVDREANLLGATAATLSFDYVSDLDLGAGGLINLRVSDDGGASYTTIASFSDSVNTGTGSFSADIGAYIAANTRIRFETAGISSSETLLVDNLQIAYDVAGGSSSSFSAAADTASLVVTAINDDPVITSGTTPSLVENTVAVTSVTATDVDGETPTYSITGGADQALFDIDATTGALSFIAPPDFESPGDVGADNVYEVEVTAHDGVGGSTPQLLTVAVTNESDTLSLWLSTDSNVAAPGAPGLPGGWTESDVLELSGPGLAHGTATGGEFSKVIDFARFTVDAVDTGALHYVNRDLTVGSGANTFDLQVGDVLVSFLQDETVLAAYTTSAMNELFEDDDLLVFRPTAAGDYSDGTFHLLLDGVVSDDLKGVTLVERNTTVGGTPVSAGSFLLIQEISATTSVDLFVPTGVGAGTTSGTTTPLIDLAGLGIDPDRLRGIELIEREVTVGGQTLAAGSILATLNVDDDVSGVAGNSLLVKNNDVFVLNLTSTGVGSTSGTAAMFLEGADVGLDDNPSAESPYALALFNPVPDLNEAPVFTSGPAPSIAENATAVTTVTVTDEDGDTPTFAISGGADQALFSIDATTGALAFVASPDFEAPGDIGADNVYEVEVTADDGAGGLTAQLLSVTVTDANDAPVFTSGASPAIAENITAVTTVTVTDDDGEVPTFAITGGADQALFAIDGTTGALAFAVPPDFEAPGDAGADNVYEVEVTADDGVGGLTSQLLSVTVTDVNEAPVFTSGASPAIAENTTAVTTVTATDEDGDTPTFTITGGADQALFTLDATTGALSFIAAPDFETPGDVGADNVYDVEITADDGAGGLTAQLLSVTVTDANDAPVFTSGASPAVAENTTAVTTVTATDPDGDTPTFAITGGADQALFTLDATTGALAFVAAPDFEAPGDIGADNVYEVEITADDGAGGLTAQLVSVTVTDANDAPVFTSGAAPAIAENTAAVTTVTATDEDGDTPTFAITGGADQALFTLDATTGALAFLAAPDFEAPGDIGADNVYEVEVTADDGAGGLAAQLVSVSVTDANDAPVFTSGATPAMAENTTAVTTMTATDQDGEVPTFAITGGADQALFTIDATTGALSFIAPPDFEAPADAGVDNVYEVEVTADDGVGGLTAQLVSVTVTDANDAPVFTSGAAPAIAENTAAVTTVTATDEDGDTPTFAISGGADQALFTLDATTGALAFVAAPDFEAPGDIGADNVYEVEITADDGAGGLAAQLVSVSVTDANDAPVFTSGATPAMAENTTAVTTMTATDQDGEVPTFAITGGADQALFTLDATTGALAFVAAPDFEAPGDIGADNVYEVEITADDGAGGLAAQLVSVSVTDANDAPVFTSGATPAMAENTTAVTTMTATDQDGEVPTFAITGGADQALFTLDATTGALAFVAAPDFEAPGDIGADNVYEVEITADDGAGGLTAQLVSVSVTDVNEAPAFTSGATPAMAENTTAVTTVTATDEDGDTPTFAITGGADQALFTLDATTGALAFLAAPDFEAPGDIGADNVYEVEVTADDGAGGLAAQLVSVSVTDANDAPVFTSGATPAMAENTTAVTTVTATDEDGDTPTFAITGGADQALFTLDATTGALAFVAAPDFEAPGDIGADNVYEVEITADDGAGGLTAQLVSVTVTDANDAPVFTSGAAPAIAENTAAVTTVTATDEDGDTPTFAITGGADQALFTLDATTGALAFVAAPDFEAPGDIGADNVYEVEVTADDGAGGLAAQLVSVSVTDANDAPVFTSGATPAMAENTTAVTTMTATDQDGEVPTFAITGGADQALFTIDATTGALSFIAPPDFEAPADAGVDNVYEVEVTADDGVGGLTAQLVSVTVTDANDAPVFTSGAAPAIAENTAAVTTVTATDEDGDTPTFAISGGADQALFTIDATTGALAFVAAPDFEAPGDIGADNVYEVEITADDGAGGLATQLVSVSVTDANDAPVFTSGATPAMAENTTAVTTMTATDQDGEVPTFAITGGADQVLFTLDATTGALSFLAAPDFEAPGDIGVDNVYEVEITADDGVGGLTSQSVSVTIADVIDTSETGSGKEPVTAPSAEPLPHPPAPPSDTVESSSERFAPAVPASAEDLRDDADEAVDRGGPRASGGPSTAALQAIADETLIEAALGLLADPPGTRDQAGRDREPAEPVITAGGVDPYFVLLQLRALDDAGMSLLELDAIDDDAPLHVPALMARGLDRMAQEMLEEHEESRLRIDRLEGLGAAFGAGFVHWLLRTGAMVGSFVASMPVWMRMDPLPVLRRRLADAHPSSDLRRRGVRSHPRGDDRANAILDSAVTGRSGSSRERHR